MHYYAWMANDYEQLRVKDMQGNETKPVRCRKGRRIHKRYVKQLDKAKKTEDRRG